MMLPVTTILTAEDAAVATVTHVKKQKLLKVKKKQVLQAMLSLRSSLVIQETSGEPRKELEEITGIAIEIRVRVPLRPEMSKQRLFQKALKAN